MQHQQTHFLYFNKSAQKLPITIRYILGPERLDYQIKQSNCFQIINR